MPVRVGYLAGIALTVIVSQLPKLFGYSVGAESFIAAVRDFLARLDETNTTALAIGAGCLLVVGALRVLAPKLPGVLIAVVGATAVVAAAGLADQVPVVGEVPAGLPGFGWPDVSVSDATVLLPAAVGIAFVAFADTSVLSRSYASRLRQGVDQNQELAALGAANMAAGLFQGFPVSSSGSRTAVVEDMGAGSQVAGLAGALVLGILLVIGTGLVHDLPLSALAAVVIVAVLGLFDIRAARQLYRWRRTEFTLAITAFAGVAVLGVLWGVGIAIALSLLNFIRRAWYPHDAVLGRVENLKGYHDTGRHPDARLIPGLVLYRFDAPLFFANADSFCARVRALADAEGTAWVVVAAEPITDVDVTAGECVALLQADLAAAGVALGFAELKDPVRDYLRRYGVEAAIGPEHFYPTIGVAVAAYLKETSTTWVDWEERPVQENPTT
jgi:MFS superfamily sulfate permease-like transporter